MNKQSRTENTIKNSIFGVVVQVLNILLGLAVRTFFIKCLSQEYLGVNGLFTNILTILSLAEMGIGGAIVYNMYKPIANNDYLQIAKLMNFYKQAYTIIGCIVALVGAVLVPFLPWIIKDKPDIPNLTWIYLLYLANTVFSYFFAYKKSIYSADQKDRVLHIFRLSFYIIRSIIQIIILYLTHNFILYLLTQIVCTLLENIVVSVFADKEYPFLKQYRKELLTAEERKPIIENVKSLFIYKIGSTALDGTDNIITSAFDGVISVGLLSNYTLITGSVQGLLSQVSGSMTGSVGNYIAKEDESKHEELLERMTFLNFLIYGGSFVILMACLTPFVQIWAGDSFVLDYRIVFTHCLNIYIFGMMNSIWTFRSTMGLFKYGKWRPLISAVINIIVSIWWAKLWGLLGVLLGTTFTRVVTNVWYDPYIVYRYGLKKKPYRYYLQWLLYLSCVIGMVVIIYFFECALPFTGIVALVIDFVFSILLFLIVVLLFFRKNSTFLYFLNIAKNLALKIMRK